MQGGGCDGQAVFDDGGSCLPAIQTQWSSCCLTSTSRATDERHWAGLRPSCGCNTQHLWCNNSGVFSRRGLGWFDRAPQLQFRPPTRGNGFAELPSVVHTDAVLGFAKTHPVFSTDDSKHQLLPRVGVDDRSAFKHRPRLAFSRFRRAIYRMTPVRTASLL